MTAIAQESPNNSDALTDAFTTEGAKQEASVVRERVFGLDFLRAAAISLVLISHLVEKIDILGFFGVELFFSLSGFLIGTILLEQFLANDKFDGYRLMNFWQRRWFRTLPNYYLFVPVYVFMHYLLSSPPDGWTVFRHLTFTQSLLERHPSFFSVAWSLCIEEWFYIVFPIPLLLISGERSFKQKAFIIYVCAFILLEFIAKIVFPHLSGLENMRSIVFLRLDAIGFGVLMAWLVTAGVANRISSRKAISIGAALLLASAAFATGSEIEKDRLSCSIVALTGIPFAFSWLTLAASRWTTSQQNWYYRCITWTSQISYSLYLVHIPIIWLSYWLCEAYRDSVVGNVLSKLLALCLTFVLASLIYLYFELPTLKLRPKEAKLLRTT